MLQIQDSKHLKTPENLFFATFEKVSALTSNSLTLNFLIGDNPRTRSEKLNHV
jgi:hypothetical protein